MNRLELSWKDCHHLASRAINAIPVNDPIITAYPVPNGGIYAALLMQQHIAGSRIIFVDHPSSAVIIIDDLIDSGKTRDRYSEASFPSKPFVVLLDKRDPAYAGQWISFPWERLANAREDGPQDNIRRILQYIGEDPTREGLRETPDRVVRSYAELFSGYKSKPEEVFKFFESPCDEMVVLRDVEFYSTCEHHMLPFIGKAHIGYIPDGRVIGLSKLARLLEIYSRRFQIQENLTVQITNALNEGLKPKGSACVIEAKHLCMACRGVNKQNSTMITSSMTGVFRDKPEARAEFLQFIR